MNYLTAGTKPYLIGLTGPIGSGKSMVRKMLEHLGALTIDADELAHQVYLPGNPGFDAVIKRFGSQVLDDYGRIDRRALGQIAFEDQQVLENLEDIVHPLVVKAVCNMLEFTPLPFVAVEAIKLLESGLKDMCDAIWIVDARRQVLIDRLKKSRGMSRKEIISRLDRQADFSTIQDDRATTITNDGDLICLWNEVRARWENLALSSKQFKEALDWTSETYQSFYMPLIQLSVKSAEDLKGWFTDAEITEDPFVFMCTHFVWETVPHISGRNMVITMMKNRVMEVLSISEQTDRQQLPVVFKLIEDFATLHLCTRITVPFSKKFKSVFEEIGYDRYTNSRITEMVEALPFKSGFSKVLLPEINYFKDGKK